MNKKIKVIELLNKIANGEEVPKKFNYSGKIFEFDELEKTYVTSNFDNTVMQGLDLYIDGLKEYSLNEEVEIIEEPEIDIQELEEYDYSGVPKWTSSELVIVKTLNKIIRKLKEE